MNAKGQDHLSKIISSEYEKMKSYVRKKIKNMAEMDEEDFIQDVILSFFSRANVGEPIENLTGYIYTSLRNKITDFFRTKKHTVSLDKSYNHETGKDSLINTVSDHRTQTCQQSETSFFTEEMHRNIDLLPKNQKSILVATEFEGATFRELSIKWNTPIGTLLARKSRAVEKLKQIYQNDNGSLKNTASTGRV